MNPLQSKPLVVMPPQMYGIPCSVSALFVIDCNSFSADGVRLAETLATGGFRSGTRTFFPACVIVCTVVHLVEPMF